MTPETGPGGRIVIDPDDLRRVAVRMRGAALLLSGAGRALAARALPPMPPGLSAIVSEAVCDANSELQDIAAELVEEAHMLSARATWAELGGGDAVSWLIPGLRRFPAAAAPATPVDAAPVTTDEEIRAGSEWAIEILDGMHSSVEALDDEIERLGSKADEVFGKNVVEAVETYADELPVKALGRFTLAAGVAVDVAQHWDEGWLEAGGRAGLNAGGGALATGLCMLFFSPTGWGIVGCAIGGGLLGSAGGDYVGERVFDD